MRPLILYVLRWVVRKLGVQRGVHRLVELLLAGHRGWVLTTDREGNQFLLNLRNYLDARLYMAGAYEPDEIRFFRNLVQQFGCTTLLDIGANIGLYTVSIGKLATVNHIHAFEPDTLNRSQLIANILLNGLTRKVEIYPYALSSRNGTAPLYRCREPKKFDAYKANTGAHSLHYDPRWHDDTVTIECRRGDDVLSMQNERLAVKIDVEGHEEDVLRGMKNLLTRNTCVMLIESMPARFPTVSTLLHDYGYSIECALNDNNYIFTNKGPEQ